MNTATKHSRMCHRRSQCYYYGYSQMKKHMSESYVFTVGFMTIFAMLSQLLLILPLLVRGEWISPMAPLSSLALFPHSPDVSIAAYLVWCCVLRIVSMILLAVAVCLTSALLKREIFTLLPVSLVLFFPHVLVALDMPKAAYVDFLSLYSCTPMLALHHARVAPIVLYLVLQAALCCVLFVAVYCRTCGSLRIARHSRIAM